MKKSTKSFCQRIWLIKPENERTKTQKAIRDVAFFAVVIYAAVISFLYFDAESQIIELDCEAHAAAASQAVAQMALNK
jgi:hypothetical protein